MGKLFNRVARLTVYRPQSDSFFTLPTLNAVVISNLRFTFTVTKDLESQPNDCTVVVYNLSKARRAEFQAKPLYVILEAGYEGAIKTLFRGDMRYAHSTMTGVEWETTLECGDGARAYKHARVSQSFKAGVSVDKVLGHIAGSMGVSLPTNLADAKALQKQFVSGVTVDGPSAKQMDRLLAPINHTWSIQDGALQVLASGELLPNQAYVISQSGGMVGVPEMGAPQPGRSPTMSVKNLLYPEIRPGQKVQVESRDLTGLFRAEKVQHVGDTHGVPWHTMIEAIPA